MHSFAVYSLLACATLSVALDPRFEFPDTVPLVKRQQPGTPQYACHEDCGLLITLARETGFCDSDEWNERYGRCMECANTYGIWKYYGEGVEKAAEQCDLSPSPSPSGAGAVSTAVSAAVSTAVKTPTSTAEEPESTAVDTSTNAPEVSETATTAVTPSEVAPVVVTSAEDTSKQTEVTTPTPTPSAVATNSASRQYGFPTFIGLVAWTIISLC
ncbi:Ff.00g006740.m01.CDS01 [Fusarium sp. VM40]|nr:Ff.00g006740.m01.CDS01 [Fusarium sp. VM40]